MSITEVKPKKIKIKKIYEHENCYIIEVSVFLVNC